VFYVFKIGALVRPLQKRHIIQQSHADGAWRLAVFVCLHTEIYQIFDLQDEAQRFIFNMFCAIAQTNKTYALLRSYRSFVPNCAAKLLLFFELTKKKVKKMQKSAQASVKNASTRARLWYLRPFVFFRKALHQFPNHELPQRYLPFTLSVGALEKVYSIYWISMYKKSPAGSTICSLREKIIISGHLAPSSQFRLQSYKIFLDCTNYFCNILIKNVIFLHISKKSSNFAENLKLWRKRLF